MAYLDTNVFWRAIAKEETDVKAMQAKAILQKVLRKELQASTSVLSWDELVWACRKTLPYEIALQKAKMLFSFPNLELKDATVIIANIASELAGKWSLKPRDALHAATAIVGGEKEIISDDSDFDRIKELKRITFEEANK